MTDYASHTYWDERYRKDGGAFEWYQNYTGLKHFLAPHMTGASRILMVGCGTSELSEDMYLDGLKHIVNVDISGVACDAMRLKHADKPEMTWVVADVTTLSDFPDACFDAAVDKGTLDALLCGKTGDADAKAACRAICRVLKPGAAFVNITYGPPPSRQHYFTHRALQWTMQPPLTVPQTHTDACTCGGCVIGHGNAVVQPQPGSRRAPDPAVVASLAVGAGASPAAISASAKRIAEAEEWNDEDFHFVYICIKHKSKPNPKPSDANGDSKADAAAAAADVKAADAKAVAADSKIAVAAAAAAAPVPATAEAKASAGAPPAVSASASGARAPTVANAAAAISSAHK